MKEIEKEMVGILKGLREDFGATAVKASLEAEGMPLSEMLRLKEIAMAAGVGLSVKIGGCEALTDARLARDLGVSILMSPMIESRFALEKFLDMASAVFPGEEQQDTKFYINIETLEGYRKLDDILGAKNVSLLEGIVLGRTDLRSALKAANVDCAEVLHVAREVFAKAKERSVLGIVGGGITEGTIPFLTDLAGLISGFETRKVVFGSYVPQREPLLQAIRLALRFEYLWYRLRQETYLKLAREDEERMQKIEGMLR